MSFTLYRVDMTIRRHMICGCKYLGKGAIVIHSPNVCRCQMGVVVLPHGGFLKKERLKLGGAANIAICGRPSWGRHLTLRGTVIEFLTARIAFLASNIGRCGSADYAFGTNTA